MFLLEPRASTILYNFLVSNPQKGKYLLPTNICPIVPLTFLKANVKFELVDINPSSIRMDEGEIINRIDHAGNDYIGVFYAHPYGELEIPQTLFSQIKGKKPEIVIIDDRCLCVPHLNEEILTNIDLILYSTGYGKIVEFGSGGFGWLDSKHKYLKTKLPFSSAALIDVEKQYKISIADRKLFEYKDTDWLETELFWEQKVFCSEVKNAIDKIVHDRFMINEIYTKNIPSKFQLPIQYQTWRFNITVPESKELIDHLFFNNMFASSHYASLGSSFGKGRYFPNAENLANTIVNLFNDHHYNLEMAKKTCEIVNQHLRMKGF